MKSKTNFKLLIALTSTIALVACNSGGASGGGDIPPDPEPSPTPVTVLPLQITQNVIPSLNKVAGHKTWYMIIKNPNSFTVSMNPWAGSASTVANFNYDANNTSPINPTKFAMAYDGAINGVTQDCLNYITNEIDFPANASCAYKFEAQWVVNTSSKTNYNFYMSYAFKANDGNYYVQSLNGCKEETNTTNTFCLQNNQNLQVNVMQVTQTANDLTKSNVVKNSFGLNAKLGASNLISYNGSFFWEPTNGLLTNLYNINYNSSNNTYTKVLNSTYNTYMFNYGNALSLNGNNMYDSYSNQNGVMSSVQSIDNSLKWVTGLDGNVYGSAGTTNNIYLLNQTNNTLSTVVANANGETLTGVSANGNLLTLDNNGNLYCRLLSNGYTKTQINTNGLSSSFAYLTNNYYSVGFYNSLKYFNLNGSISYDPNIYKVDIDNCLIVYNNYISKNNELLNTNYGITAPDSSYNYYIESIGSYSDGTDGN